MYEKITRANVNMFAIRHYDNPHCESEAEFHDDMKRFKYIKRLLKKYKVDGVIKERLLLNHIIIIFNCWQDAAIPMLFHKIDNHYWPYLKSFLMYLNRIPEKPRSGLSDIEEDINILDNLEGIK